MRGKFITFEGIDASGKSTQAMRLFQELKSQDVPVIFTREPGGLNLDVCERIRNIILNHTNTNMTAETELLLFMASRAQHVAELIKPNLEKGVHVLCDRFVDATMAYQGYGRGLDLSWIQQLNEFSCKGLRPDLTLLLDIAAEEFVIRTQKNNKKFDRIESLGSDFQAKIREGYLSIARKEPGRMAVVDSMRNEDEVASAIFGHVSPLLGLAPAGGIVKTEFGATMNGKGVS